MAKTDIGPPSWFRVVKDYGFPNGPTVPFLVGATAIRPINVAPKDAGIAQAALYQLLKTISSSTLADGYGALVKECPTTDAYVIVPNRYGAQPLEWDPSLNVNSVDTLFGKLWTKHSIEICAGRFSRNRVTNQWEPFNDHELARISELVGQ